MVHGDDSGIVFPPRVSPVQVVIVPVYTKTNAKPISVRCTELASHLVEAGIRAEADIRDNYKSGWKYNHWELKGVPVRLEIGQRELDNKEIVAVRRDTKEKITISQSKLVDGLKDLLINIQQNLFQKAKKAKDEHTMSAKTWDEFLDHLNNKNIVRVPFCCTSECEGDVKVKSAEESRAQVMDQQFELTGSAKSLCIPFEQPDLPKGTKCFACDKTAEAWTLFGRSY